MKIRDPFKAILTGFFMSDYLLKPLAIAKVNHQLV